MIGTINGRPSIKRCCEDNTKTYKGFKWKYGPRNPSNSENELTKSTQS